MIALEAIVDTRGGETIESGRGTVDAVLLAAIRAVREGDDAAFETGARVSRRLNDSFLRALGDALA